MLFLFIVLSFLPILLLLVVSLWKGVRAGIYSSLMLTTLLFFIWDNSFVSFLASIISALISTINILLIIFGAVFLYHIMEQKGYISGIKQSLNEIHPDKSFRFFFLAFFLTAFFESVSGFGTPLAIVPLLLISLGFSSVLSISVVLMIDGLFSMAGAIGTPVNAGLESPLNLISEATARIYLYSALSVFFAGFVLLFFVYQFFKKEAPSEQADGKQVLLMYLFIMVPFVLVSYYMKELSGLIASLLMAILSYFFLFKKKPSTWRPWIPYWVLVLLLLIPKLFSTLSDFISFKQDFQAILDTTVNASFQPLKSPMIPFVTAGLFALYFANSFRFNLKPVILKTSTVFFTLFPSLIITQLMINSGNEIPSMIDLLAGIFVKAGDAYPIISPFIGLLGTFISGSTTVSNVIFGSVQNSAALQLNIPQEVILSTQLTGASLGNAVCLFNIIAAAAVTGTENYSQILKKNLLPVLLMAFLCSLIGLLLTQLL